MSEPLPPKPKQYLLMADEITMAILTRLVPSLLFVHVDGMDIAGNPDYSLLVSPKTKPAVAPVIESPIVKKKKK